MKNINYHAAERSRWTFLQFCQEVVKAVAPHLLKLELTSIQHTFRKVTGT